MSRSQVTKVEDLTDLANLTHDIFLGDVVDNVRRDSATAMLFQEAGAGDFYFSGDNMNFAVDLRFKTGGVATDGSIPDYQGLDSVEGSVVPIRRYARIAVDNFIEARATGPGAYEDLAGRIFKKLWDCWSSMEMRHSIGASSGLVGAVASRTDSDTFVIKDAFGNVGTNPVAHLAEGSVICWYDMTATAGIDGAGIIDTIDYSTNTITMTSSATWEPGDTLAADDLIYFCTTDDITANYFSAERDLAPNGVGVVVDPNADYSTVFGIAEGTYGRWKPYRKASTTFDHIELQEHWLQMAAKRGFAVTPQTDVCVAFPSVVAQLARTMIGFQQQAYTGGTLEGGYTGVRVGNMDVIEDHFFLHNALVTFFKESLYRVNLGGEADFWSEDGSMWSRISDFDGKDAWVGEYLNCFSNHRGAHGALTAITTDVTDSDYDPVPNH